MIRKFNPFTPTRPVGASMFSGHSNALRQISNGLRQTKDNNPVNFLILGQHGTGKSSFVNYIKTRSSGEAKEYQFRGINFLSISFGLSNDTLTMNLVKSFSSNLERELRSIQPLWGYWNAIIDVITRINYKGLSFDKKEKEKIEDVAGIIDDFAAELSEISRKIISKRGKRKNGILIILDEASKAHTDLRIGHFFKSLSEALIIKKCENVSFILAGHSDLVNKLRESDESSVRIFTEIELKPLTLHDSKKAIIRGMKEANFKSKELKRAITMEDSALNKICAVANGDPHLLQKLAASAFDQSTGHTITLKNLEESKEYQNYQNSEPIQDPA